MKRFVQASLVAALAITSFAAPAAMPRFYRETIFFDPYTGEEVGWHRYYCDGTVREFGSESGLYEDYILYECP